MSWGGDALAPTQLRPPRFGAMQAYKTTIITKTINITTLIIILMIPIILLLIIIIILTHMQ